MLPSGSPLQNRPSFYNLLKQAIKGGELDCTSGSLRSAIILLAIPMMLEMVMESVFALVDLYFVGHLPNSSYAIQTVGLTESILTVIYSLATGIGMAATAVVARRMGEKSPDAAAKAAMQAILIAFFISLPVSILGLHFGTDLLLWMGASAKVARQGTSYIQLMLGSSLIIVLLFLINGIFRGAGNAAMAMKSLWVANMANILLCPVLIHGLGPLPAFGLTGAALATILGRGMGVAYQLYHLLHAQNTLKIRYAYLLPDWFQIRHLAQIATPATLQFIIASCSWVFLAQLVAVTGGDHGSAGYQTALRLMLFFLLPAWGLSNAAATLVGQNLGARQFQRAEQAVLTTARYNMLFMALVMVLSFGGATYLVAFFTHDHQVREVAVRALRIMSLGYIFYGLGMVLNNTFNGAGDTWTPTWVYLFGFWLLQIPLAYLLARHWDLGPDGVFIAVPVAETVMTLFIFILFRRGSWKNKKV